MNFKSFMVIINLLFKNSTFLNSWCYKNVRPTLEAVNINKIYQQELAGEKVVELWAITELLVLRRKVFIEGLIAPGWHIGYLS